MIEVREAKDSDRESAARVLWKAFDSLENFENVLKADWIKNWHQPEKEDWSFVAVDGDKVVANLSVFASENNVIRGKPIRFGGVWAVATEPSFRRRGLVKRLFEISFPKMKEEGCVLSILDPFYRPFYEQFGYALAEKRVRYEFKKHHIRVGCTDPKISCREANEDDFKLVRQVEQSMGRLGSRFFYFDRVLKNMLKKPNFILFERDGVPVGTVAFMFEKTKKGEGIDLIIYGTRYTDDSVIPSIIEQVRNYAVNVNVIKWYTELNLPIQHYFSDIHDSKSFLIGSMMMRVVDFEGYCKSISIPEESSQSVTIKLEDDMCPWNRGTYRITPEKGELTVQRVNEEYEISLNPFQLSSIISGVTPATLLKKLNEIDCTKEVSKKLASIFPEDIFVSYMRF